MAVVGMTVWQSLFATILFGCWHFRVTRRCKRTAGGNRAGLQAPYLYCRQPSHRGDTLVEFGVDAVDVPDQPIDEEAVEFKHHAARCAAGLKAAKEVSNLATNSLCACLFCSAAGNASRSCSVPRWRKCRRAKPARSRARADDDASLSPLHGIGEQIDLPEQFLVLVVDLDHAR